MKKGYLLTGVFFILLASYCNAQTNIEELKTEIKNLSTHNSVSGSLPDIYRRFLHPLQDSQNGTVLISRASRHLRTPAQVSDLYRPAVSIIDDSIRYNYNYNDTGSILLSLKETLEGGNWSPAERVTYSYDETGYLIMQLTESYKNGGWTNYFRYTFTNDSIGQVLTHIVDIYIDDTTTVSLKTLYSYDNTGRWLEILMQSRENNNWENLSRYSFSYTSTTTNELFEDWENGIWTNDWRASNSINSSGQALERIYEDWNNGWQNVYRYTYAYDPNGDMISWIWEDWSGSGWIYNQRYSFGYDGSGNRITSLLEDWVNEEWKNDYLDTYGYDAEGNLLTEVSQDWVNNNWQDDVKFVYAYDNNSNAVMGESFIWNSGWVPAPGSLRIWYNSSNDFIYYYGKKAEIQYDFFTGVGDNGSADFSYSLENNYPNPFNPSTIITFSIAKESRVKLNIYNALGQLISRLKNDTELQGTYKVTFNAKALPSGVYFYTLSAEAVDGTTRFAETGKMVLLK